MPEIIRLPSRLGDVLVADAIAAGALEICGFIAASQTRVRRHAIANRAQQATDRFDMDLAEQIAAFKQMRADRARLIAIYHSHPAGEAEPSIHDIRGHTYPEAAALIVAPGALRGACIRAWRLRNDEPAEQPIKWTAAPWHDSFL